MSNEAASACVASGADLPSPGIAAAGRRAAAKERNPLTRIYRMAALLQAQLAQLPRSEKTKGATRAPFGFGRSGSDRDLAQHFDADFTGSDFTQSGHDHAVLAADY